MSIRAVFFDMGNHRNVLAPRALRLEATPGLQQKLASAGIELRLSDEQLLDLVTNGLSRYHQWRLKPGGAAYRRFGANISWRVTRWIPLP
jgi:hypothetical protein